MGVRERMPEHFGEARGSFYARPTSLAFGFGPLPPQFVGEGPVHRPRLYSPGVIGVFGALGTSRLASARETQWLASRAAVYVGDRVDVHH